MRRGVAEIEATEESDARQRSQQLAAELSAQERQYTMGSASLAARVTDSCALQYSSVRSDERLRRRVPRRLARLSTFSASERVGSIQLEPHEVSDRVTQEDILENTNLQTQKKRFELALPLLGPYNIDYSYNGTHLAMVGHKGHFAVLSLEDFELLGEVQLKERCRDVVFVVDHSLIAIAQRRYVYMYSKEGVEVHILASMQNMHHLAYLRRHMLLVAASSTFSVMQYMDVSTGEAVGSKSPDVVRDPTCVLRPNPANGVVVSGDFRGIVKFWSPAVEAPLVQIKANVGGVTDVAFHRGGVYFVTLGGDQKVKLWDCRTLRAVEQMAAPTCSTMDFSDRGMLALGGGAHVHVWCGLTQGAPRLYYKHAYGYGKVAQRVRFRPFEDVLCMGHRCGVSSIIVPGSGEANPDFYVANPFETERHRGDRVVSSLLDKLPPDTIAMDLRMAQQVDKAHLEEYQKNVAANRKARNIKSKKSVILTSSEGATNGVSEWAHRLGDEIDEQVGYTKEAPMKIIKSLKQRQQEKKQRQWEKKDSAAKVRSKQGMRHSRVVQRQRYLRFKTHPQTKKELSWPKSRRKSNNTTRKEIATNAALSRFL